MAGDGSIYGPIDVKMEHYARLLMDEVFGVRNFRNSITRIKGNPKNFKRYYYGNIKDTILFYAECRRPQSPRSYVTSINGLPPVLNDIARMPANQ